MFIPRTHRMNEHRGGKMGKKKLKIIYLYKDIPSKILTSSKNSWYENFKIINSK